MATMKQIQTEIRNSTNTKLYSDLQQRFSDNPQSEAVQKEWALEFIKIANRLDRG